MAKVDGLGFYLLVCLGFVFGALVEFTIITMLKQKRASHKVSPSSSKASEHEKTVEFGSRIRKLSALKAAAAPYRKAIHEQKEISTNDNGQMEEADINFLREIDFNSFITYLIGFILFNCFYWIEMIYG